MVHHSLWPRSYDMTHVIGPSKPIYASATIHLQTFQTCERPLALYFLPRAAGVPDRDFRWFGPVTLAPTRCEIAGIYMQMNVCCTYIYLYTYTYLPFYLYVCNVCICINKNMCVYMYIYIYSSRYIYMQICTLDTFLQSLKGLHVIFANPGLNSTPRSPARAVPALPAPSPCALELMATAL